MTAPTRVAIVGGPRDGDIVPFCGSQYREPVAPAVRGYLKANAALPPVSADFVEVRVYDFHWWWNGSERVPRYVLHEQAKGLGA